MNFTLFERYGMKILVIEDCCNVDRWTLYEFQHTFRFKEGAPRFIELIGTTARPVADAEAASMLKKHEDDSEVRKFIQRLADLPF